MRSLLIAAGAALLLAGCAGPASAPQHAATVPPSSPARSGGHRQPLAQSARALAAGCRAGNPLANVYHEDRLVVRIRCLTVTGTVAYVAHEDDGDFHVDLNLPPSEAHLLNQGNRADQYGQLVTEIVPADEPGCTPGLPPRPAHGSYNYGICTGADLTAPPVGARVTVTGPYVLDANHGWMEIHPVWVIKVISRLKAAHKPGFRHIGGLIIGASQFALYELLRAYAVERAGAETAISA